jgi:hypothetical protein
MAGIHEELVSAVWLGTENPRLRGASKQRMGIENLKGTNFPSLVG